ncbi:hypothetical protein DSO57_1010585 [Entomophthora muscae]|uniref:Uncharacterized protein n=1 Tax=Entomophthora muscae TaxID=34485 RepID=A0ACC2UFC9_9FUNG|nr:hypothetical protein DSO57_1010585 [Entomophthora muscae]
MLDGYKTAIKVYCCYLMADLVHSEELENAIIPVGDEKVLADVVPEEPKQRSLRSKLKLGLMLVLVLVYYVASMILTPASPLLRSVICGFIVLKIFFKFFPVRRVTRPISRSLEPLISKVRDVPSLVRHGIGAALIIILLLAVTFGFPETESGTIAQRCQSLFGLGVLLLMMIALSRDFRNINWQPVISGIFIQLGVGLFVMKTSVGKDLFRFLSSQCDAFLGFATEGSKFVIGPLAATQAFVFSVLPAIIFFAAFIQILYHLGVMQWVIVKSAWFFKVVMDTSGSESVVAAASPFIGMCESPMLVEPFLSEMTRSELHQVMSSGFSTIAGSVLIAFISFGINSEALITSCVMAVPCSLALSKLRYPETEESKTKGHVILSEEKERSSNILHAATNGATQGITLCLLISSALLAIISLIALVNSLLTFFGSFLRIKELTLQLMGGYVFLPFAWLVGTPSRECEAVGQLMAIKLFTNEFVAFDRLAELQKADELSTRASIIATYALCGFANFSSIGIQIGCLGAMAPTRKRDLAELALSAMFTGTICTFVSAAIAGILI